MLNSNVKRFLARKKRKRFSLMEQTTIADFCVPPKVQRMESELDGKHERSLSSQHSCQIKQPNESDSLGKDETDHSSQHCEMQQPQQSHILQNDEGARESPEAHQNEKCHKETLQGEHPFPVLQLSPLGSPVSLNSNVSERDWKSDIHLRERLLQDKDVTIRHLAEDLQQTRAMLIKTREELHKERQRSLKFKEKAFELDQKLREWNKCLHDWAARNQEKPPQEWDERPTFGSEMEPPVKSMRTTLLEPPVCTHNSTLTAEKCVTSAIKQNTKMESGGQGENDFLSSNHSDPSIDSMTSILTSTSKDVAPNKLPKSTSADGFATELSSPMIFEGHARKSNTQSEDMVNKSTSSAVNACCVSSISCDESMTQWNASTALQVAVQEPTKLVKEPTKRLFACSNNTHTSDSQNCLPVCPTPTKRATSLSEESDGEGLLRDVRMLAKKRIDNSKTKQPKEISELENVVTPIFSFVDKENANPNLQDPRRITMTPKARNPDRAMSKNLHLTNQPRSSFVTVEKAKPEKRSKQQKPIPSMQKSADSLALSPALKSKHAHVDSLKTQLGRESSISPSCHEYGSSEDLLVRPSLDALDANPRTQSDLSKEKETNEDDLVQNKAVAKSSRTKAEYSVVRALNGWRSTKTGRNFVDEALGPQPPTTAYLNPNRIDNPYKKASVQHDFQSPQVVESMTMQAPTAQKKIPPDNWLDTAKSASKIDESEINYKYVEVVRGKKKRECLPGHSCQGCDPFWAAVCDGNNVFDRKQFQDCSRHRATHSPECTPPNFWDLSFRDEVLARNGHASTDATKKGVESTEV